ncbi:hypothetical protein AMECASPLE_034276, partial [Ameca splendens]
YFDAEAVLWAMGATALVSFGMSLFAMQSKWDFTSKAGCLWMLAWSLLSFLLMCAIIRSQSGGGSGLLGTWFGAEPGRGHPGVGGAGAVCLSLPQEGRGPPPGSRGWLPLGGTGAWTWEYRVCMGSVSWVLDCSLSWISLGPPILWGAYFLPATLPAGGWSLRPLVYLWFSVSGAGCFSVCWLTPGGCLPGPGSLGSVGPLLGGVVCPWLDLLGCGWLPVGPVGSSLRLPGASPLSLLDGSPGTLHCSSLEGVAVVPAVVLLGFLCFGGPSDVCGSDLLSVHPGTMGQ